MKKRKFDEGGSVYERAKKFLRDQGVSDDTPALDEKIASARMRRGETVRSEIPGGGDAVPMTRTNTGKPEPIRAAPPAPRAAPAPKPPVKEGTFTDSDSESRAAKQSEADDENVKRIQRARDEEDNDSRIRQARYRAQEKEQALERVQPETALTVGKAARLAQAAAGALSSRRAAAQQGKEAMDMAGRRAARGRAERAEAAKPAAEIMKSAAQTQATRRAAETRERAQRKLQEVMGRGSARMRRERQPARGAEESRMADEGGPNFKRGGKVSSGFSKASSRADGIAKRGKTRGRIY